tara:strand:- start:99 stop:752 length:654 start_codon:yes stop_codon:yes gene_type:complete
MLGRAVEPSPTVANGFVSSASQNLSRSAIVLGGNEILFKGAGSSTTARGSAITMTEYAAIDSDGIKMPSGKGIKFDAYGSGNILDDYEEGTFDSNIYDDHDDSLKISFTAQGDYVKIGNVLTFNAQCFGNGVASTTFTGKPYMRLPFTIAQANATIAYIGYYNGVGTAKQGYVLGSSSNEIRFATQLDNPYNNQLADGDTWGGNVRLYISGTVAVEI